MYTHWKTAVYGSLIFFSLSIPAVARESCVVSLSAEGGPATTVTESSRQRCIDEARIARPRKPLTPTDVLQGPKGAGAISPHESVYCEFIPYRMDLKSNGKSRKFWCRRTDREGGYFNDRLELAPEASSVSDRGFLLDAFGNTLVHDDGKLQRADVIKVKYTFGGNRGREVHTEVAVSRFLWALGFPADQMYLARVHCRGCSEDPFKDIRRKRDNHAVNETSYFPRASVERKLSRTIETKPDEGFEWEDVYRTARWEARKRVEFEAYVLALNMVHFHNGRSKQNSVGCEMGAWDLRTGKCAEPVLFLDDLGSTFGGGKSRGDLDRYRGNTVFRRRGTCELRADLAGFRAASEDARRFLVERLVGFDVDMTRALFEAAGFGEESTGAPLSDWVATFLERIAEVRRTKCRVTDS